MGLLGKWVKYVENLFINLPIHFFWNSPIQVRPVDRFSPLMAQTTRDSRKGVPFGGFVDIAPYWG